MKRIRPRVLAVAAVAAGLTLIPSTGHAAGYSTAALFNLNEPSGTVLVDSSGAGHNGTIGAHVVIGGGHGVHTYLAPTPAYDPARIDTLPVYANLNPGSRDLRVSIRLHTTQRSEGHILSWGQTPHHMLRIEVSNGLLWCQYRGSAYAGHLTSVHSTKTYNDAAWHTLVCTKTASTVTMTVDGVLVSTSTRRVGSMSPVTGVSIAGKRVCDGTPGHDCDYFAGHLDWVKVELGS
jgi:hypothetical protein